MSSVRWVSTGPTLRECDPWYESWVSGAALVTGHQSITSTLDTVSRCSALISKDADCFSKFNQWNVYKNVCWYKNICCWSLSRSTWSVFSLGHWTWVLWSSGDLRQDETTLYSHLGHSTLLSSLQVSAPGSQLCSVSDQRYLLWRHHAF